MADDTPSTPKQTADDASELRGLDPGELLARGLQSVRPSVGAGPWEPPTLEEVSRLLPQYRIEQLIGRGGMGAVYKGIQLNLDRPVAIKLLPAEMAMDQAFVARFEREARTLAKLQHSRIVTIFDFGRTAEGHLYFVMEYIDGTDLRRILRGPGLDAEQALALVGQLCDALQAAHREGIVHRDIKPENVLITRDGYVKLADFGLARPPQEDGLPNLTQTNLVLGTPDYMAPEQRFGATKADARSDIFALGVMLYEMLTGQTPRGVFDPPSHKVKVDVRIDEVVLKALQSEPERRYQKASELKTAVENIRTTPLPAPVPAVAKSPAAKSPAYSRPLAYAAAALVVLGAMGIAEYLHRSKPVSTSTAVAVTTPASIPVMAATPAPVAAPAPVAVAATPAPAVVAVATPTPQPTAVPPLSSATIAEQLEKIVPQYVWLFHNNELRFLPGGSASHPGFFGGFTWSVDRSVQNAPTIRLAEVDEEPDRALRSTLWFYPDLSGFNNYEYLGKEQGPGSGGVRLGLRLPLPNEVAAATADTNPLAAQMRQSIARAQKVYDALLGYTWSWTTLVSAYPPSVVRFDPDGHVSGGWTWELLEKLDGTFIVDCSWGEKNGHQYMVFDPSLENFDSFDSTWTQVVKGHRLDPVKAAPALAVAPAPTAAPTQPAVAAAPASALPKPPVISPAARRAAKVYDAIVGYQWSWAKVGDTTPPIVIDFNWDGHVSGGWTWKPLYKADGETFIDCSWGDNGHEYLRLNEACDAFEVFNSNGQLNVRGQRLAALNQPINATGSAALATAGSDGKTTPSKPTAAPAPAAPAPMPLSPPVTSPGSRRAAKVYDAIVGYHWSWAREGDTAPPMIVDFNWDGHVSGGWTWKPVYKPDGETLIDCSWGDNGHEYLRMNDACDSFEAFNSDGHFNVKGQRLAPINQPINATGFAALATVGADGKTTPSKQIEPLLEPCLNAILAPLGENPQMPRVPVEKLQAVLGGEAVKAKTPLQKQIYQYGIAVCESLTNGMDERALTKAAAVSSSWVPSVSNGGSIVSTMPLRGWDAGHAGDAIRKKQRDERAYADRRADQYSIFMESSAYKAWVTKAALLRQNVMALYSKLVQLEAADAASTATTPAPTR